MSDQDLGKKLVEEMEFESFPDEYKRITGLRLKQISRSERPDIVCLRSDGIEVGVELTKVIEDPDSRLWGRILDRQDYADPFDTAIRLQEAVYRKEEKRSRGRWYLPGHTILVLQLMDAPIEDVAPHLDEETIDEMSDTGFFEIWVADYTVHEAYGTVQLFGIKPRQWRGLHDHAWSGTKPYG
ncbi:MAG: hypothetical protein ACOYXR_09195 [Nitrospirota bacterium]